MNQRELDAILEVTKGHTPAPWTAYSMVDEVSGYPMTPDQVGLYVCNSVRKSVKESGSLEFLIIQATKPDGPADVCHVGNGPTSPANARLIALAPVLLAALAESHQQAQRLREALVKHGSHDFDCEVFGWKNVCSCGFDAALAAEVSK